MSVDLERIQKAAQTIRGKVARTPLLHAPSISASTGAEVWVKHENLQPTHSFKVRGARVKMESLTPEERARGVVAMSAGNHAQAVAFHGRDMGIAVSLVMPEATPFVKLRACSDMGAEIILAGETLADCQPMAERIEREKGRIMVHPYDDDDIICGQGSIALEMLEDCPDLQTLLVPIGGGGLISGISVAAKSLRPDMEIIGVEAKSFASMTAALGGETAHCGGRTIGEGIAVKNITPRTRELVRAHVDDILLVDEDDMEDAIACFLDQHKSVAEGAGAAGLAALLADPQRFRGRKIGIVLCGANIDARILNAVVSRKLARQQRIIRLHVEIMDQPGALARVADIIAKTRGNILEVQHMRLLLDLPAKQASLDLTIETQGKQHSAAIIADLRDAGFRVRAIEHLLGRE